MRRTISKSRLLIGATETVMSSAAFPKESHPKLSVPPLTRGNSARLARLAPRATYFADLRLLLAAIAAMATTNGTSRTNGSMLPPEPRELGQVQVKAPRLHVK